MRKNKVWKHQCFLKKPQSRTSNLNYRNRPFLWNRTYKLLIISSTQSVMMNNGLMSRCIFSQFASQQQQEPNNYQDSMVSVKCFEDSPPRYWLFTHAPWHIIAFIIEGEFKGNYNLKQVTRTLKESFRRRKTNCAMSFNYLLFSHVVFFTPANNFRNYFFISRFFLKSLLLLMSSILSKNWNMIFAGKLLKILSWLCVGALMTAGKNVAFRNSSS